MPAEQVPGRVGAELPEDSVEDEPVGDEGTATRRGRGREEVLEEGPLLVGEEHGLWSMVNGHPVKERDKISIVNDGESGMRGGER